MRDKWHSENYGGAREGSGRKKMGQSKPLRINLPENEWAKIDQEIAAGTYESYADYFRRLHNEKGGWGK
ncbi:MULTISPECIES: hypothetical protein [unclassified Paenibacillus]|uniref:hypothetical protein n=1 Tax=unclassified Paenibacillus TaxID=185978 RepID=UPI0004141A8E|nr:MULTISPECIES: hypothetical protein [unclassified Paenibacillus]KGP85286.1 hypothetical protein P364_0101320 [Paenibacillus sp. MAEPY2]KGP88141.1 hypothetical protein P363_0108245 [Paenibacillus sp. MAEPY1]